MLVIFFLGGGFRFDFLRLVSVGGQTLASPHCHVHLGDSLLFIFSFTYLF